MPWFFTDEPIEESEYTIFGENARHIIKSLRMNSGEKLTLCSRYKTEYECEIRQIGADSVRVRVLSKKSCENEPDIKATLFQALPKGDKMDFVVQKAVELGAVKIVPMITSRCVSRPDEKSLKKKTVRWQKIACQAAMQSHRGIIPQVAQTVTFKEAAELCKEFDKALFFYEGGGKSLREALGAQDKNIALFIGSEGGFSPDEVSLITESSAVAVTLGKRILRTETAPLAALSAVMFQTGNFD